MVRAKQIPRGIRNNNPGNIRIGNVWLGEVPNPTDPEFEQFCTMEYGVRAMCIILRRYIRRYKKTTIRQIVTTWAPGNENNTAAYISSVSKSMNLDPDTPIRYEDADTMYNLIDAMTFVENGQRINREKIVKGYSMA